VLKPHKKLNVLIVDDHQMVRDGIRTMLESQKDNYSFTVTEAESGEDAVLKVKTRDYDIVLMDYQLPKMNGSQAAYEMLIYKPQLKILAVSNYDEYEYVKNMIDTGAKGYLLKNVGPSELTEAIETILSGNFYYANEIAVLMINKKGPSQNKIGNARLTPREIEVLKLIASEMSNKEIAQSLHIEKRTVDAHRQNLLNKLKAKNTVSLVRLAFEHKLV